MYNYFNLKNWWREIDKVNFILGINNPDDIHLLAADISGDGLLNVLDVVYLVNIILAT